MKGNEYYRNFAGESTLHFRQYDVAEFDSLLRQHVFDNLILHHTSSWEDLKFLKPHTNKIKNLSIHAYRTCNWSTLSALSDLENLSIYTDLFIELDFVGLHNLQCLSLSSGKGVNDGYKKLKELKCLSLNKYKEVDLSSLSALKSLEWLSVTNSRALKKLYGMNALKSLRGLNMYANSVEIMSDNDVKGLKKFEVFDIESCKKLEGFQALRKVENLKTLRILNCGGIPTLSFLKNCKHVDYVQFGGTFVEDGVVSSLMELEKIRFVQFKNKRGYDKKLEEIRSYLNDKWDGKNYGIPIVTYRQGYLSKTRTLLDAESLKGNPIIGNPDHEIWAMRLGSD